MNTQLISAIILTYNEEIHIKRCIESLLPITKNILIVDSFSTDKTTSIASQLGAKILQRPWKNYADQFQWALENNPFNTKWIIRIDADEYLDAEMQSTLPSILENTPTSISGYRCNLRNVFLGKKIKFGGYDPLNLLRIWRNGVGRIESRWMDEHIVLTHGETAQATGEIIHNNLNNNRWWTEKHNKYADREMIDILNKKYFFFPIDEQIKSTNTTQAKIKRILKEKIYNKLPLFFRPSAYFILRYIFFLGFLDGKEGFAYHFLQAYWYRSLVDTRVLEAEALLAKTQSNKERLLILEKLTELKLSHKQ